jgi:hypothetical protein
MISTGRHERFVIEKAKFDAKNEGEGGARAVRIAPAVHGQENR